jgi:large subunit ribosomal protein L6
MYSMKYQVPGDVQVEVSGLTVTVKGKGREDKRSFNAKHVEIKKDGDMIEVITQSPRKVDRADVGTITGHIRNMVKGVENGVTYKMKAVYAHFPLTVKVTGNTLNVENFLGEKKARTMKMVEGVKVEIKGQDITLTGVSKERVGLCAAQIEQLCRVRNRDRRVFQDGVYIIEKDSKPLK